MELEALPLEDRNRVFALLLQMAWADGRLTADEVSALRGALGALGVRAPGPPTRPPATVGRSLPRTAGGRKACFAAAAWLAGVDGSLDEPELVLLRELSSELELDERTAALLVSESVSTSFAMSAAARAEMNAARWAIDLHAVLAWTLSGPGGVPVH